MFHDVPPLREFPRDSARLSGFPMAHDGCSYRTDERAAPRRYRRRSGTTRYRMRAWSVALASSWDRARHTRALQVLAERFRVYLFGMSQDPRKAWFANVVKSGLE